MQDTLMPALETETVGDDFEPHVAEFLERGYTVIPNILTPQQVQTARRLITEVFERERDIATQRGWSNATYQCSYMLPGKHAFFRKLPSNPKTLSFVRRILGNDCILSSLNGLTMAPGGPDQPLHLDQAEHTPGIVININATHTLDDFTTQNGATRIVPKSHLRTGKNRRFDDLESQTIQIEAPAGSLIAFNGGAIHAGSANKTSQLRRCLHAFYTRPWAKAQWDFKRSFTPQIVSELTDDEKRLFGFMSREPAYDLSIDQIVP